MRTAILLTAASLALVACNSKSDTAADATLAASDAAVDTGAMASGMSGATDAGTAMASSDQMFAEAAAASDMFELQSSELAKTKATTKPVKDFAAMMIADHTKSSADLKKAAMGASPAVTATQRLTAVQQADLDALRNATTDFDKLYAQKQVGAHEKAKALLSDYSATAVAGPLRDFASKTVTVVSGHLEHARKLPQ